MKSEQRKYPRTPIKLTVNLTLSDGRNVEVETWDISDGGIGIQFPADKTVVWTINQPVIAKVKGLPVQGPEIPMKVVRIADNGIGLAMVTLGQ
ncbi:PilZ domain-containing protein [Reinekea sp. G2M2-21]|uniref:PilZ domain-containing protein n=1 Tax=Reinekea sp. G2M2-21 TaxID=2788942 RepID=UPI0018A98F84|nr:PilZ domain-containing protein [Reinekea sp. G2M2-21]